MSPEMTNLFPQNISWDVAFPSIKKPKLLGYFSVDRNRQYLPDFSQCKYLKSFKSKNEQPKYNLNKGYEIVVHKNIGRNEKIDHLLRFISGNLSKYKVPQTMGYDQKILKPDIVCFRGLLKLIMCSPFDYRSSWQVLATKYKGTIYLCRKLSEEDLARELNMTEEAKRFCSYGFKFEQYLLTDDPNKEPNTDEPVIESEEFCCMFGTTLDGMHILYGAEMDGIESEKKLDLSAIDWTMLNFIELKVKMIANNRRQNENFYRFRLRDWWCQSFLVGIEKIIYGERDHKGIVQNINELLVKDIPSKAEGFWKPSVCLKFCSDFLKLVKDQLATINCAQTVFLYEWTPNKDRSVKVTKYNGINAHTFLPNWYIDTLK